MFIFLIPVAYSILAGVMSIVLFYLSFTNEKHKKVLYIFSLVFLIASWSGLEWSLWVMGYDMFSLILAPVVPLDFFFLAWIVFAVWYGESIGERKIWICFLISLAVIFVIARLCMNCIG